MFIWYNSSMKKFWSEFKKFAVKGNAVDLAVGIIVGAAFSKIVSSLVENILTPIIGILSGGKSFENLSFTVGTATLKYGMFIEAVIDFLIISLVLFIALRFIMKLRLKQDTSQEKKKPEDPADIKILKEIRDELKKKK